ncbi:MAG: hypothetical protein U0M15_07230 [Bacillota bacterium]|nr:hypothetical protein [Bacillota bacterium]
MENSQLGRKSLKNEETRGKKRFVNFCHIQMIAGEIQPLENNFKGKSGKGRIFS